MHWGCSSCAGVLWYRKSDPKDFLAHWFKESGHPFLAVSYPIEHPVFEKVYPEFNNSDRAHQLIASARDILEQHNLGNKVILLLWSWAGFIRFCKKNS